MLFLLVTLALAGSGTNDAGSTDVTDVDTATGIPVRSISVYWHLGGSRSDTPAKTPTEIRPLAWAAVYGTDAGFAAEGIALFGSTWWDANVTNRTGMLGAMRTALVPLAKTLPPP